MNPFVPTKAQLRRHALVVRKQGVTPGAWHYRMTEDGLMAIVLYKAENRDPWHLLAVTRQGLPWRSATLQPDERTWALSEYRPGGQVDYRGNTEDEDEASAWVATGVLPATTEVAA